MKFIKIAPLFILALLMSCSTDSNNESNYDEPEILDLVAHVADSSFDKDYRGKYVGVFGHYLNSDLHGKIYVNVAMDSRYAAIIELVDNTTLRFSGTRLSRSNPNVIKYEGSEGSFIIDFSDYENPVITNVLMNGEEEPGYIVLTKAKSGKQPDVMMGAYEETGNTVFNGNWDLITDPATNTLTPFSFPASGFTVTGNAETQEINMLVVSHVGSATPLTMTDPNDFDTNAAIACAPAGITIPTTQPVLIDIIITGPFPLGNVGRAISAGGQTSTINGSLASWSLNYTPEISFAGQAATYSTDACATATSGTWSWNGRTGTNTVID